LEPSPLPLILVGDPNQVASDGDTMIKFGFEGPTDDSQDFLLSGHERLAIGFFDGNKRRDIGRASSNEQGIDQDNLVSLKDTTSDNERNAKEPSSQLESDHPDLHSIWEQKFMVQ